MSKLNLGTVITTRETKTLYRDGDKCIKLFNKGYSKQDVLNEALNQARLEDTELNIPQVLEVTMIDGAWGIIFEFIEGKTLTEIIAADPENVKQYIDMMIDLQLKIHAQKCPMLPKHRDKMFRKISATEFVDEIKYELHTHLNGMPKHNKICHGDFRPSNIIITPDDKPYIIDWSHATQGNASGDVARTYLVYLLTNQKENGEYYLNRYCEKTDTPRKYVEQWVRIVAASQTVKGKKEEFDFLDRIVNVMEAQ
ncbi:MAG: phosphotransferase [Defluviitaleaceae bacterium]|nr:phosphotransferase [Defluviitaleaceae bacterium]